MADYLKNDPRYVVAKEVADEVLGRSVNQVVRPGEPANVADLQALMLEHCFTDSWTRSGLPRTVKSLLTVTIAVTLGTTNELRTHIAAALHNGVTREEIVEVLIHAVPYCGAPRVSAAFAAARDLLADATSGGGEAR